MSGRVGGFAGLRGLKMVALGALVAGTLTIGAGPAAAHDDDGPSWRHEHQGWGERDRWRAEQRRQEEWRERQAWQERQARREHRERAREEWRHEKWREHHDGWRGAAYGGPPAVVYAPAPYGVYAPPARSGFEFSVNIPIR